MTVFILMIYSINKMTSKAQDGPVPFEKEVNANR